MAKGLGRSWGDKKHPRGQKEIVQIVRRRLALLAAAALAVPAASTYAAATWSGATNTTWSVDTNWSGGNAPADNLTTDVADFNSTFSNQPTLTADRSVAGITVGTSLGQDLVIGGSGFALSLGASGLAITSTTRAVTFNANVGIGATQNWTTAGTNPITVNGNLSGSANLFLGGGAASNTSTLPSYRLNGSNSSYTGALSFVTGSGTGGVLLGSAASMTGGLIDLNLLGSNNNLWLTSDNNAYTFGIDGTETTGARVKFRGAGTAGLYLTGGDVTWNPGGGTNYTWSGAGTGAVTLDFGGSNDSTPRMFYLGNSAGTFTITGADKTFRNNTGGTNPGRVTLQSALGSDGGTQRQLISSLSLLVLTRASVAGGGGTNPLKLAVTGGATAISNVNQLPGGNLNLSGGVLVLDNIAWSTFATARSLGAGDQQFRLTGGGFAARSSDLLIPNDNSGGLSASTFDVNFILGASVLDSDGTLYAKNSVTIARDTTLTAARTITVAPNGAGLGSGTPVLNKISGSFSGAGSLNVIGSVNIATPGEVQFSGANSWTGAASLTQNGAVLNAGAGGLVTSQAFVRFDGDGSLPTGATSSAYLAAVQRNNSSTPFGFILVGSAAGQTYDLASGYKLLIGAISTSTNPGTFGVDGGKATLQSSSIYVHSGNSTADTINLSLLARSGSELTLGTAGKPVVFVGTTGQDLTSSSTATTATDSTGTRTLTKRGDGTIALRNVSYTKVNGTADISLFVNGWLIGRGTNNNSGSTAYFDGAVRGLSFSDAAANDSNSLRNFFLQLRGGVYEIDNSGGGSGTFNATIGTSGAGKVSVGNVTSATGLGGGGFSAYGGNVTVDLNTLGTRDNLTWASSGSGFVQNNDSLILGSQTATARIEFYDNIALNGGTREIRVIDNTSSSSDRAAISGVLSGSSSSGINKTGSGVLELAAGTTHTYGGATSVSAGTLLVNGSISGTGAVSVANGATLGGGGSLAGAVTTSGTTAKIAPGDRVGALSLVSLNASAGAELAFELGATSGGPSSDSLTISGAFTGSSAANGLVIDLLGAGAGANGPAVGVTYTLVSFGSASGLDYSDLTASLQPGLVLKSSFGNNGFLINSTNLQVEFSAVPEPSAGLPVLVGMLAVLGRRRRKN